MPARTQALAVLRRRDPACYALARFCGILSAQMLVVGVGWHVYAITHDPLALGLAGLSSFLPFVALVLFGGHVADRAERRLIVVGAYAIEAGCALALLLMSAAPLRCYAAGARHVWRPARS